MQAAKPLEEEYEPREEFDPTELREARTATVWHSPAVARWRLERRTAVPLVDGAALEETAIGSATWLASEIFAARGDSAVVQPLDLRADIAGRAAGAEESAQAEETPSGERRPHRRPKGPARKRRGRRSQGRQERQAEEQGRLYELSSAALARGERGGPPPATR